MGVEVLKLTVGHLNKMVEYEGNEYIKQYWTEEQKERIASGKYNFAVVKDGEVLLVGGVTEYWTNRGEVWAVLNQNCKKNFLAMHNAVKRYLDVIPIRRIEASVLCEFEAGHRWVRTLGFTKEADKLRAYRLDGKDVSLYAKVRD